MKLVIHNLLLLAGLDSRSVACRHAEMGRHYAPSIAVAPGNSSLSRGRNNSVTSPSTLAQERDEQPLVLLRLTGQLSISE